VKLKARGGASITSSNLPTSMTPRWASSSSTAKHAYGHVSTSCSGRPTLFKRAGKFVFLILKDKVQHGKWVDATLQDGQSRETQAGPRKMPLATGEASLGAKVFPGDPARRVSSRTMSFTGRPRR